MFTSIRARLTFTFVALTIIPLVIVGTLITLRGFNTLQVQSVEFQDNLAQRTSISLEAFFDLRRTELVALTEIYGLDTLDPTAQRDILLALLSKQPAYYQAAMVNKEGQETIRITRGEVVAISDLANWVDDPLFKEAIETNSISFSEVYFDANARDRFVTLAVPITDLFTGDIGNVLIVDVRFQEISDTVLRELNLAEGEDVYITNNRGVIIAHRDPNFVLRETTFAIPQTEGRHKGLRGGDAILATDKVLLANLELIVVAENDYKQATTLANDLFQIALIITLTTLVLATIIVIWSVSRIVNPIVRISGVAKEVQSGNLSARSTEAGNDEIALLGQAFNQMTDELQRSLEGLRDNVGQLEKSNEERGKLIHELQVAKEIADENSRLKSEFLATMSHELRTPLNAIEGFTSIMLSGMGIELNARAEDMVRRVSFNSKRLLHLINDFLDLSRIEAGRLELVKAHFSPVSLAKKWENQVSVLAQEKGLEFTVKIDSNLPPTLLGDDEALSKIAINLLSNAFKFTHQGRVSLVLQPVTEGWMISVSDTGIGIPPHAREYIFDEFRQVDGSSKRQYGGTGLGLALVQKLSRAMGGNVSLQSELGKGSTFNVTLPLEVPD